LAFSMSFTPMVTYPIILVFSCLFGEECYTSQNKKTEGEPSVFQSMIPNPLFHRRIENAQHFLKLGNHLTNDLLVL